MAKELRTQTEIRAPAGRVWQVLSDGDRYPEWNPFIVEIQGTLTRVGRMRYRFKFLALRAWATAAVLRAEPDLELRWAAHFLSPRLFNGEHYFVISAQSASAVVLHHGEVFTGVTVPLVWPLLRRKGPAVYAGLNEALRTRVEAVA